MPAIAFPKDPSKEKLDPANSPGSVPPLASAEKSSVDSLNQSFLEKKRRHLEVIAEISAITAQWHKLRSLEMIHGIAIKEMVLVQFLIWAMCATVYAIIPNTLDMTAPFSLQLIIQLIFYKIYLNKSISRCKIICLVIAMFTTVLLIVASVCSVSDLPLQMSSCLDNITAINEENPYFIFCEMMKETTKSEAMKKYVKNMMILYNASCLMFFLFIQFFVFYLNIRILGAMYAKKMHQQWLNKQVKRCFQLSSSGFFAHPLPSKPVLTHKTKNEMLPDSD